MPPTNFPFAGQSTQERVATADAVSMRMPDWALSPEIWLMFRPAAAFEWLAALPAPKDSWDALRRPLFMAFWFGCMISLVTSQRLTMRHVTGGMTHASLLLLGQIAALAIVAGRERKISFPRTINIFFAGYGPWTLWIILFSSVWAFMSKGHAGRFAGPGSILPTAGLVALWSGYINFRFFERVLQRKRARAVWNVVQLAVMCWILCVLVFGYGVLWSECMRLLGR
jgi:hypothetical protein